MLFCFVEDSGEIPGKRKRPEMRMFLFEVVQNKKADL